MEHFSIVIPAYNEEKLIEARLQCISNALPAQCTEIIVVCNGCTDSTAKNARNAIKLILQKAPINCQLIVEELKVGSKINALNHGVNISQAPYSVLLDADIDITSEECAQLVSFLHKENLLAASPVAVFDYRNAAWINQRFYHTVSTSTYNKKHRIANVIALSKEAKSILFPLPNVIADDAYIQRTIGEQNYQLVNSIKYTFKCPEKFLAMLKVQSRIIRGNLELKQKFPSLVAPDSQVTKTCFTDKVLFVIIKFTALLIARIELTLNIKKWHRDDTSRY